MEMGVWMGILVGFLIIGVILVIQLSPDNLSDRCCQECLTAFSQSPVAVGPQAARCNQFTTGAPLSQGCQEYFSSSPRTVAECENEE